jgi:alpha-L-arabinofuranosidase
MTDDFLLHWAVISPTYDGPTYPSWLSSFVKLPYIDAVACMNDAKSALCLSVTNRHEKDSFTIDLDIGGKSRSGLEGGLKAKTYTITGRPEQRNDFGKEEISIVEDETEMNGQLSIKACTLSLFVIEL